MNLTEFIAQLRIDLNDTDEANYRWTDVDLENHIGRAVKLYSQYAPLDLTIDIATTPGSRTLDLSEHTEIIKVHHVEYPQGEYPPFMQQFSFFENTLTIEMADEGDGSDARLYCGMLHTVTEEAGNIPTIHEEIICEGAEAFALYQKAVYAADRVSIGGQASAPEFARQAREYRERFDAALARLNRKIRRSRLYTPAALPQTTPQDVNDHVAPGTFTITASVYSPE